MTVTEITLIGIAISFAVGWFVTYLTLYWAMNVIREMNSHPIHNVKYDTSRRRFVTKYGDGNEATGDTIGEVLDDYLDKTSGYPWKQSRLYRITLFQDKESGMYVGVCGDVHGVVISGETEEDVLVKMPSAINKMRAFQN